MKIESPKKMWFIIDVSNDVDYYLRPCLSYSSTSESITGSMTLRISGQRAFNLCSQIDGMSPFFSLFLEEYLVNKRIQNIPH